jgi:hypothetical protein
VQYPKGIAPQSVAERQRLRLDMVCDPGGMPLRGIPPYGNT